MLKTKQSLDEELRKAVSKMQRSLDDLLIRVNDANAKLDHVIVMYHSDRYAPHSYKPYDPFNGYQQ